MSWFRRFLLMFLIFSLIGFLQFISLTDTFISVSGEKIETSITEIPIEEPLRIAIVFSAWFEMNFLPFEPIGGQKEPIQQ